MVKICKNCIYYKSKLFHLMPVCSHPSATRINIITGDKTYTYCHRARQQEDFCGALGKEFAQKESFVKSLISKVKNLLKKS